MKNSTVLLFLSFTAIILIQGCAKPVIRMQAMTDQKEWKRGEEQVFANKKGLELRTHFLRSTEKHLIYEVTVTNYADQRIIVGPQEFYYMPLDEQQNRMSRTKQRAINPEQRLLELDKKLMKGSKQIEHAVTRELLLLGLDVSLELALQDDDRDEQDEADTDSVGLSIDLDDSRRRQSELVSLQEAREFWAENTLRLTTLKPGNAVTGLVFFPRYDKAKYLDMNFMLQGMPFEWRFRQHTFK